MNAHNASYNLGFTTIPPDTGWGSLTDEYGRRVHWFTSASTGQAGYAKGCLGINATTG